MTVKQHVKKTILLTKNGGARGKNSEKEGSRWRTGVLLLNDDLVFSKKSSSNELKGSWKKKGEGGTGG